jgi:myo-inositol-1(or 4)-monophosphatase
LVFRSTIAQLEAVESVAQAGARELMPHWRSLSADEVTEKAVNDLVSAADRAAEEAILARIRESFPDHRVLSEEAGWSGSADGPTWIVDPLDGTTNFVHGIPHFAVSVAVAVDDRVTLGVVVDPVKGDVFRAAAGHGAWWNGQPCRVSSRQGLAGALLTTGFPFKAHRLLDPYLAIFREVFLRCKAVRRTGSAALDLAYCACGLYDGFFEFALGPWDVAAGSLLVSEAGGIVTDMDGQQAFLDSGDVVCGPPGVHRELLQVVHGERSAWSQAARGPSTPA